MQEPARLASGARKHLLLSGSDADGARLTKTIEEVARAIGVSVTTVRLVTSGQGDRYRISARTQQRVSDYVSLHGLRINQVARSLKLQRSEAIGLVIPEIGNPFFASLMAELEVLCREQGLILLTASTQEKPERIERALDTLIGRGVDGLIVAPSTQSDHAAALARQVKPRLVFVDRVFNEPAWPAVASDHFGASVELTAAMLAADPRPIAFLCANPALPSIAARLRGFHESLAAADAAARSLELQAACDDVESGRQLMARLLSQWPLGSHSILCSSLLVLEGALKEVRLRGGHVAADLLLGTFDDHPMLDFLPFRVMSAAQNVAEIAKRLFGILRRQGTRQELEPAPNLVSAHLVERR